MSGFNDLPNDGWGKPPRGGTVIALVVASTLLGLGALIGFAAGRLA